MIKLESEIDYVAEVFDLTNFKSKVTQILSEDKEESRKRRVHEKI